MPKGRFLELQVRFWKGLKINVFLIALGAAKNREKSVLGALGGRKVSSRCAASGRQVGGEVSAASTAAPSNGLKDYGDKARDIGSHTPWAKGPANYNSKIIIIL